MRGVGDIFFFFQAEDGIRDLTVTGVQTCALPIWLPPHWAAAHTTGVTSSCRTTGGGRAPRGRIAICGTPCTRSVTSRPTASPWSRDRKSTRLNSSHSQISYAVFCLKKKKKKNKTRI